MYKYIFTGLIHPERVDFSVSNDLFFNIDHPEFNIKGKTTLRFEHSKITVIFESDIDYDRDPNCNLETLKNYIEDNVRMTVDVYCYVNSYYYEIEITQVECDELGIVYTFPVQGEWNIKKSVQESNFEFNKILNLFYVAENSFLKDVLADFRRAAKYTSMTASFCFRAIETIRRFYFEDPDITNDKKRRKDGWKKLGSELNFVASDFDEIRKFALPNRHGVYPLITYVERERIMNFTRKLIDKFIEKLH